MFWKPGMSRASVRRAVWKQFGRDARKPFSALGRCENWGAFSGFQFGIGSVGQGGSVGLAIRPRVSSACSRRTGLSAVLKIRVSLVRFFPWPPFPTR